ncbi:MAG: DNA repair protein [Coriobacteriia bacterium]|nr:DNA repair protein [Coriobacteriia bacterium]
MDGATREKVYGCIDLKTFYASVECAERGLDPFTTNLVVADPERSETTICLAISPAMKALGVRNRCRLYEIPEGIDYLIAKPRMRTYMRKSAEIYSLYLRYISPEDIHVYSIDECFIDFTPYLDLYGMTPKNLANMLMDTVLRETGICATAGIGTNLFLAKIALDITAKHAPDNIGFLDQETFFQTLWTHRPLTDIWNVGPGIAKRLARFHVYDLKGITQMDPDVLYAEFGVNAEYLIDHAWGWEPCTIAQIKAYQPEGHSMGNSQVLPCDYTYEQARMVLREMVDASVLELVEKRLVTNHVSLSIGYSWGQGGAPGESAPVTFVGDHGKHRQRAAGTYVAVSRKMDGYTNSYAKLLEQANALFAEKVDPARPVRRISVAFGNLADEDFATYGLFDDQEALAKEKAQQQAILAVKEKFGKNALVKGISLKEKATGRERNKLVGGHNG